MLKKCLFLSCAFLLISSAAFCSPLTDYSKGKTSIDITVRPSLDINDKYDDSNDNWDGRRSTFDWRVTSGLGNNWAIQYGQYNAIANPEGYETGFKSQELNVLYKLDKNTSAFVGYHRSKFNATSDFSYISAPNKNTLQVGLVSTADIAQNTKAYGIVGFGKDLANYEAGVSYEFAKNLEFNVNYRYKKVKNLSDTYTDTNSFESREYRDDVTAKGWGYGITYKF